MTSCGIIYPVVWSKVKTGIGTRISILAIMVTLLFGLFCLLGTGLMKEGKGIVETLSNERVNLSHIKFILSSLEELQRDFEIISSLKRGWLPIAEDRLLLIEKSIEALEDSGYLRKKVEESFLRLKATFLELKRSNDFKKLEECSKLVNYISLLLKQKAGEVELRITTSEIALIDLMRTSQKKGWALFFLGVPIISALAYLIVRESKRNTLTIINYLKEAASKAKEGAFPITPRPLNLDLLEGKTLERYINELLERVNESVWRIKELIEAKSSFLSIASHELKTPLTSILGYTEILLEKYDLPSKERDILKIIREEAKRLSNIVERMLTFISLDPKPKIEKVNLSEIIEKEKEELKEKLKGKKVTLKLEVPHGDLMVKTDGERVRIALKEILDNAIKFTEEGEIRLRVKDSRECVIIEVEDSGPGIREDKREHIVELFTQGESFLNRRYEGIGLGLPLAIKALKGIGELFFENMEKGSRFCIKIFKDIEIFQKCDMIINGNSL